VSSASTEFFRLYRSFSDVDELTSEARHWNLDFRQLDRGPFRGDLLQFVAHRVQIADASFGRTLHQTGAPPSDLRTIAVPATPNLQLVWRGKQIDGNSLMLFPRGGELASVSQPDFHVYTCSFPETVLDAACDSLQLGSCSELCSPVEAIACDPVRMRALRSCLADLCDAVRCGEDASSGDSFADRLTIHLPVALVSAIAAARGVCRPATTAKREEALSRALDFLEASIEEHISVGDIARAAGVSARTLEYAFGERFGVSPKEYLTVVRLRGARIQLRESCSRRTRVADVAGRWGFWHMGQFAADYRRRFGELPSETLRRTP
jgi:AraC family ethanolamine operon transcriptional activator